MKADYGAMGLERAQLYSLAGEMTSAEAGTAARELVEKTVDRFAELSPPMVAESPMQVVTVNSPAQPVVSRKPGNITLNWRRLFDSVPELVMAASSVAAPPWLVPFAALCLWKKLKKVSAEELSEVEAGVLCALWRHRDERQRIPEDHGFGRTNELRADWGLGPLSRADYDRVVTRLLAVQCIEMDAGTIWLREWVRITY